MAHAPQLFPGKKNSVSKVSYWIGASLRETGNALDRVGMKLQGNFGYKEPLPRHRRLMPFNFTAPVVNEGAFVAPNATLIGKVKLGNKSSVWYGAVLRGDVNSILIGDKTVIGDRAVVHCASEMGKKGALPTVVGNGVTVEMGAILHACTVEDGALIEAGAIVMDGAVVGKNSVVKAGSTVTAGTQIPAGEVWEGSPAQFSRKVESKDVSQSEQRNEQLRMLADRHMEELDHPTSHLQMRRILEKWFIEDKLQRSPLDPHYRPETEGEQPQEVHHRAV
jgi:carbonic anhydrase/acetyltransferase-like protein (isoleucine patch superfamily)